MVIIFIECDFRFVFWLKYFISYLIYFLYLNMKLFNNKTFKEIYFSKNWRLGIDEFWIYNALIVVAATFIWVIFSFIIWTIRWWYDDVWNYSSSQQSLWDFFDILEIVTYIVLWVMNIFVSIKRAHDIWKSGHWLWCLLIPLYNIYVWAKLSFEQWLKEDNEYWPYEEKKMPLYAYWIFAICLVIIFGWDPLMERVNMPYDDIPLNEFNERINEHSSIGIKLSLDDNFYDKANAEMKKIVDNKLWCDCYWKWAPEKPSIKMNVDIWREIYAEFEDKLLEMTEKKEVILDNTGAIESFSWSTEMISWDNETL